MTLRYALKHIFRAYSRCSAMLAVSCAFMLLIHIMVFAAGQQEARREDALRNTPVKCVMSDLYGMNTNDLVVTLDGKNQSNLDEMGIRLCEGFMEGSKLPPYIRDVSFKRTMGYHIVDDYKMPVSGRGKMVGISNLAAEPLLSEAKSVSVTFFDGHSEEELENGSGIIVSTELLKQLGKTPGDTLPLAITEENPAMKVLVKAIRIFKRTETQTDPNMSAKVLLPKQEYYVSLPIIGQFEGGNSNTIYCSWKDICTAGQCVSDEIYTQSLSFYVTDNAKLNEFKKTARLYFYKVGNNPPPMTNPPSDRRPGLIVYDATLVKVLQSIDRNIQTIKGLTPVLFVISVAIGFIVSLLFTRGRRREFAIMRSLGAQRLRVFGAAFIEQLLMSAIGVMLALAVLLATSGNITMRDLSNSGIFLLCFMTGSTVAVIRMISVDVMKIMSNKE